MIVHVKEEVRAYLEGRPGQWCPCREMGEALQYTPSYVSRWARALVAEGAAETRMVPGPVSWNPKHNARREFRVA